MAKEILEYLFGDSYKDIRPLDTILTIKSIEQLEAENKAYIN